MREYKVYKRVDGKIDSVKQGWSWPAFLFAGWWAVFKRLWALGVTYILVFVFMGAISGLFEEITTFAIQWAFGDLSVRIYLGITGNDLKEGKLIVRGFDYQDTVTAPSGEAALVVYSKQTA